MGYLALYRKYRPIDFDSVYGQDEVVTVIQNAIVNNKVSHAYLFSGPRGTGKTTIAKIIARLVNCEHLIDHKPCGKCYNCLNFNNSNDIVEIDAASNNGVDEIRELRDKINLVPSNSKYKVYIIDEVHMLTNQAFNALLKTLEEPPSHVIFILATTEPSKIPLTISSRCQKFRFSKISDDKIVDRLKEISKLENIDIDDDALYEIARISDGGMRDSINLLDQLVSYCNSKISINDVYVVNGSVSYSDLSSLLADVLANNKVNIINLFDKLNSDGKEINKFIQELMLFLKDVILYKNTGLLSGINVKNENIIEVSKLYSDSLLYKMIEKLNDIQSSVKLSTHGSIIFMTLILKFSDEIANVKVDNIELDNSITKTNENLNNCSEHSVNLEKNISREINNKLSDKDINVRINNALATASKDVLNDIKSKLSMIDDYILNDNYSVVSGLLRDFVPVVASDGYIIFSNEMLSVVDRFNENIDEIEMFLRDIFNFNSVIVAITTKRWNEEKSKYIDNLKSGIKYSVIKSDTCSKGDTSAVVNKDVVNDLISLVGEGIIEYK